MTSTLPGSNVKTGVCLGTSTISLQNTTTGSKQEALMAIFHLTAAPETDEDGEQSLRVVVTDGVHVFQDRIEMKDVKMKLLLDSSVSAKKQALQFAGYLLDETKSNNDQVEAVYTLEQDDDQHDANQIKLVVKYRTNDNVDYEDAAMKKAWSGSLSSSCSNNSNQQSELLNFYQILGSSINRERKSIVKIQEQMETVQQDRAAWKEAADQLSGKWEQEKDTLFSNFVTLYNTTRLELDKVRTERQDLQEQLLLRSQEQPVAKKSRTGKKKASVLPQQPDEEMPDQPDDMDNLVMDETMVTALAAGKRVNIKSEQSSSTVPVKKNRRGGGNESSDDSTTSEPSKKRRFTAKTNLQKASPTTFSDSSDDSIARRIRTQIAEGLNSDSDDDDDDDDTGGNWKEKAGNSVKRALI